MNSISLIIGALLVTFGALVYNAITTYDKSWFGCAIVILIAIIGFTIWERIDSMGKN